MQIVKDKKYPDLYRVEWADGTISTDSINPKPWEKDGHYGFYSKTRAKQFLKREGIEDYAIGVTYRDPNDTTEYKNL